MSSFHTVEATATRWESSLTPEHVTSLMAELIEVGAGDWVLDPAAGTASFLIAAMHRMFKDAAGNEATKEDILERIGSTELNCKTSCSP